MHTLASRIATLLCRWDLPGQKAWLERAGALKNPNWTSAGHAECKGRWHGYTLRLNLADYHQRGAYFFGRLFDLPVQVALRRALSRGDEYLDIGANIGLTTLIGAHAVGSKGTVTAIEPNPAVASELRHHVESNNLSWVRIIEAGFSDREETLTLSVPPTGNTGAGTFGKLPPRHKGKTSATYDVPVVIGDNHIKPDGPPLTIKIDVEGHENAALRGLTRAITARTPAIIAEVNPPMLTAGRSSAAEFLALLHSWNYEIFSPGASARPLRRPEEFWLSPVSDDWLCAQPITNIVALVPGSEHHKRLTPFIRSRPADAPANAGAEHAEPDA